MPKFLKRLQECYQVCYNLLLPFEGCQSAGEEQQFLQSSLVCCTTMVAETGRLQLGQVLWACCMAQLFSVHKICLSQQELIALPTMRLQPCG